MERDLYKQLKIAKILEFKLNTVKKQRNFEATANFFNFFFQRKEKCCSETVDKLLPPHSFLFNPPKNSESAGSPFFSSI